jgi:hypothetical protein
MLIALAAVGCGTDKPAVRLTDGGMAVARDSGPPLSSYCDELPELQALLFRRTCSADTCHGGDTPQATLDFSTSDLMSRLVGVRSTQCSEWLLIDPGKPESSLLFAKLSQDEPPCGERMPYGGDPISETLLDCIGAFIASLPEIDPVCDECNAQCVDLQTDAQHCGSCGNSCPSLATCNAGQCACPAGFDACDGQCVNLQTDHDHCGACPTLCSDAQVCLNGACSDDCGSLTQCGGSCVDLSSDILHCTACDTPCPAGASCNGTGCECPGGNDVCDGTCVDLQSDEAHCGVCNETCSGEEECDGGDCVCTSAGETSCSGDCVDLQNDAAHCGSCGEACTGEQACTGGDCVCTTAGETSCSGDCVDLESDEAHCGSCGEACDASQTCEQGVCTCSGPDVSFAADVLPILSVTCAAADCHDEEGNSQGMVLTAGMAHAELVGVDSEQCGDSRQRVTPNNPGDSYILDKLRGEDLCDGERMPYQLPPLSDAEIALIANWICHGAAND